MLGRMPVPRVKYRHATPLGMANYPVERPYHGVAFVHGKCAPGTEIILHIDYQECFVHTRSKCGLAM
jgi:hypothetical protein